MQMVALQDGFINKKTISRLLCVQVMYVFVYHMQQSVSDCAQEYRESSIISISENIMRLNELGYLSENEQKMQLSVAFFRNLLHFLIMHYDNIRLAIAQVFQEKNTNILRDSLMLVGATELLLYPNTAKSIIINDFLKIAKSFGVEQGVVELLNAVFEQMDREIR